MTVIVWHNPKCGTSRKALAYLEERGVEPEIYLYLEERPSKAQIEAVLKKAGAKPSDFLRPGQAEGEAAGGYDGASEAKILSAMVKHPILIQRPVVITKKGALVARPVEKMDAIL